MTRFDEKDVSGDAASVAGDTAKRFATTHDSSSSDPITHTIVNAVAAAKGVAPMAMDPLYTAVDSDALEQFFDSIKEREFASVTFAYDGCRVTVTGNGDIDILELG